MATAVSLVQYISDHFGIFFCKQRTAGKCFALFDLWRGIRNVWIDALSINQGNLKERGGQVANIGNIYRNCSRVIVYLGPDIIQLPVGRFAHRQSLHGLEKSDMISQFPNSHLLKSPTNSLEFMLRRRYFSRLWVIQELILSRQALIRVGDTDFLADSSVWRGLSPMWEWDSTGAPWVQQLGEQQVSVADIYDLLTLTSKSQAADPRDRLFGVLNLLKAEARDATPFPDYSLSAAHVFTGFFAYCLINLKKVEQFLHAVGLSQPSLPSWVLDWTNQEAWESTFSKGEYDLLRIIRCLQLEIAEKFGGRNWGPALYFIYKQVGGNLCSRRPWTTGATVDRDSGALSVYLTRFCVLPCRPRLILYDKRYRYYDFSGQRASIYFVTENTTSTKLISSQASTSYSFSVMRNRATII